MSVITYVNNTSTPLYLGNRFVLPGSSVNIDSAAVTAGINALVAAGSLTITASSPADLESVSDVADLFGNTQGNVTYTGTAGQSSLITGGRYDIWSNQDCYLKVAPTANDVTSSTGYLLRANNTITLVVRDQHRIGAVQSTTSGTVFYFKIG